MAKIPNAPQAFVKEDKIKLYLLSDTHPVGKHKARVLRSLGFSLQQWDLLRDALCQHAQQNDYTDITPSINGPLYEVQCHLQTPDGRNPCITTVWEIAAGQAPSFVTASHF